MKLIRLISLLTLLLTGCNDALSRESSFNNEYSSINSQLASSIYSDSGNIETSISALSNSGSAYIDPEFSIRITDCFPTHTELDVGNALNLNSSYVLCLQRANKTYHPCFKDISFEYDTTALEIIDCIISNQKENDSEYLPYQFIWSLRPLKLVDSTLIKVFYQNKESVSTNVSIKDLTVGSSTCATTEKVFDTTSSMYTGELVIFDNYASWKDYRDVHKELTYIKNEPNNLSFENYEYALVTIYTGRLGKNPEPNGVFIQNETLYYDIKSEKEYFEEEQLSIMVTTLNFYICLIRYPSKLNVKNHQIWYSYTYVKPN